MSKDWTAKDLVSYSITMIDVAAPDFFKGLTVSIFEELDVDPLVVNGTLQSPDLDITLYRYFKSISTLPSSPHVVTTEFCRRTLELLNYPDRGSDLFIHYSLPFTCCGKRALAEPDLCLIGPANMVLLVLVHDKPLSNGLSQDPEPALMACAIAAFQHNNYVRTSHGAPPLDIMTIPCVAFVGTRPVFYLVPVTLMLSKAAMLGLSPVPNKTEVRRCVTVLPERNGRLQLGADMDKLEFRKAAMLRLAQFHAVAKAHWVAYAI
ncbi:hypothetical protein EV122DRAFT_205562 [Schizophyllum commune]